MDFNDIREKKKNRFLRVKENIKIFNINKWNEYKKRVRKRKKKERLSKKENLKKKSRNNI